MNYRQYIDKFRAFKDSKVVDSEGNPLVVYHGTKTGIFSEFRQKWIPGFFFTDNKEVARRVILEQVEL